MRLLWKKQKNGLLGTVKGVDYSVVDDGRLMPVRGRAARSSCSHQLWLRYGLWETRRDEERLLYVYRRIRGDVCRRVLPAQKKKRSRKVCRRSKKKKRDEEKEIECQIRKRRGRKLLHTSVGG